jgi:hypothetical protein
MDILFYDTMSSRYHGFLVVPVFPVRMAYKNRNIKSNLKPHCTHLRQCACMCVISGDCVTG